MKFTLTLAFVVTSALLPPGAWPAYVLLCAVGISVALLSDLGIGFVLKRALLAAPFVLAALPLLVTLPGSALAEIRLGSWTLEISAPGLERFVSVAVKSWISVLAAIVLASTTPFPELLAAMRSLRLPKLLAAVVGLMWRYVFVLVDEAIRLMRAREARSGRSAESAGRGGGSVIWRARVTGGMAGNLMLRSIDRSDRIYAAMASRGYDGEVRLLHQPPLSRSSLILLVGGLALLSLILLLGLLL